MGKLPDGGMNGDGGGNVPEYDVKGNPNGNVGGNLPARGGDMLANWAQGGAWDNSLDKEDEDDNENEGEWRTRMVGSK